VTPCLWASFPCSEPPSLLACVTSAASPVWGSRPSQGRLAEGSCWKRRSPGACLLEACESLLLLCLAVQSQSLIGARWWLLKFFLGVF